MVWETYVDTLVLALVQSTSSRSIWFYDYQSYIKGVKVYILNANA